MKRIKLFEEYNSQTDNLQKVKITSGSLELIGHIVQKDEWQGQFAGGLSFFIPEKDGFIWNSNDPKPDWIKRSEEFFNKNIGKELPIMAGNRHGDGGGKSFSFGEKNKERNDDIHIPNLLEGDDDVTFEFI